eukprot:557744-Rhodomonas_salina.1
MGGGWGDGLARCHIIMIADACSHALAHYSLKVYPSGSGIHCKSGAHSQPEVTGRLCFKLQRDASVHAHWHSAALQVQGS